MLCYYGTAGGVGSTRRNVTLLIKLVNQFSHEFNVQIRGYVRCASCIKSIFGFGISHCAMYTLTKDRCPCRVCQLYCAGGWVRFRCVVHYAVLLQPPKGSGARVVTAMVLLRALDDRRNDILLFVWSRCQHGIIGGNACLDHWQRICLWYIFTSVIPRHLVQVAATVGV